MKNKRIKKLFLLYKLNPFMSACNKSQELDKLAINFIRKIDSYKRV